jgi:hypothetical protein
MITRAHSEGNIPIAQDTGINSMIGLVMHGQLDKLRNTDKYAMEEINYGLKERLMHSILIYGML